MIISCVKHSFFNCDLVTGLLHTVNNLIFFQDLNSSSENLNYDIKEDKISQTDLEEREVSALKDKVRF